MSSPNSKIFWSFPEVFRNYTRDSQVYFCHNFFKHQLHYCVIGFYSILLYLKQKIEDKILTTHWFIFSLLWYLFLPTRSCWNLHSKMHFLHATFMSNPSSRTLGFSPVVSRSLSYYSQDELFLRQLRHLCMSSRISRIIWSFPDVSRNVGY